MMHFHRVVVKVKGPPRHVILQISLSLTGSPYFFRLPWFWSELLSSHSPCTDVPWSRHFIPTNRERLVFSRLFRNCNWSCLASHSPLLNPLSLFSLTRFNCFSQFRQLIQGRSIRTSLWCTLVICFWIGFGSTCWIQVPLLANVITIGKHIHLLLHQEILIYLFWFKLKLDLQVQA